MDWKQFANLIIDNIEGGYYHPDMKTKLKNGDAMGISGETLFGMDRLNGGELMKTADGVKFWSLADSIFQNHHGDTAWYNYKPGGAAGQELRRLAGRMMLTQYEKYTAKYLSAAARSAVNKSPKLQLHFYYACWNGPKAFEYYAGKINSAVSAGTTSEAALLDVAYTSRKNYISKSAEPVKKCWGLIKSGGSWWPWLIAAAAVVALLRNSRGGA